MLRDCERGFLAAPVAGHGGRRRDRLAGWLTVSLRRRRRRAGRPSARMSCGSSGCCIGVRARALAVEMEGLAGP